MSVDVSTLEIRVISDAVEQASRRLNALERQGSQTERATYGLTAAFARMAAPLAGVVSVAAGLEKLVSVTREFDVLNAGLITATGSAAGATQAFEALQQFAATTPYDLQQVTEGFTKLVNYGLKPSERALTAYGDTASAMGKNLDQMIEAVADASTGEFERLRDFGIRASKQGDDVSFTFRGVTTTVKNSSDEIQGYLIGLGENNFAKAMAARMDTLDGAISNLGDSWDQLFLNLSSQGAGDVIEQSVRIATNAINQLNALLASGQLEGYLSAISGKFSGFGSDFAQTFQIVSEYLGQFEGEFKQVSEVTGEAVDWIVRAFTEMPENIRAGIQILVVELASNFDEIVADATNFYESISAVFTDDTVQAAQDRYIEKLRSIRQVRKDSIDDIFAERDSSIQALDDEIKKADEARAKYDALNAAKSGDRLEGFGVAGTGGATGNASGAAKTKKDKKGREKAGPDDDASAVESLEYELQQEEELLSVSYARRFEQRTIWDALNDEAASTSFSRKMEQWAQEEQYKQEMDAREYQENEQHFVKTQNQLASWLEKGKITQERYQQLSALNVQKYNKNKEQLDKQSQTTQLGNASIFAGAALNIATTLFSDNKGIAIASALMSTYQGAAQAMKDLPYPANLAAAATVVASGIAQVQNIRSTNIGGGGGGGSSGAIPSIPSTITNGLDTASTSTLPTTTAQETPVTRTVYLNIESNGKPMADDTKVEFSSVRQMIDVINEEIKMGNVRLVL